MCFEVKLSVIDWNAISAIFSFISIVIVYLTIREMRISRIESYKPKIIFKTDIYKLYLNGKNPPAIWGSKEKSKEDLTTFDTSACMINMFNLGLGPALDIKITWLPEELKMIDYLEPYFPNIKNDKMIKFVPEDGGYCTELFQESELLHYNIAGLQANESIALTIPFSIANYYSTIAYLSYKNKKSEEYKTLEKMIPVRLKIEYRDTSNNDKEENIKIIPEFKIIREGLIDDNGKFEEIKYFAAGIFRCE